MNNGIIAFQSTLPARGATCPSAFTPVYYCVDFNPRSPHGERLLHPLPVIDNYHYFNPRSPHGERLHSRLLRRGRKDFNPRSPHGERHISRRLWYYILVFQSTLPARGATGNALYNGRYVLFQSTLPARGATTDFSYMGIADSISIHAPRTGSDPSAPAFAPAAAISIHAPRTGSDVHGELLMCRCADFNPRSPHGERLVLRRGVPSYIVFQSTLPARGATNRGRDFCKHGGKFQSTLPARGATGKERARYTALRNFNPRSPHGERLAT